MTWEVEATNEFDDWYRHLPETSQVASVNAVVEMLEEHGPALGRPIVGEVDTSRERGPDRIHNLKELRIGSIRILFVFDPRRTAILLLGGDKSGEWKAWYERAIPAAERLYAEYLSDLRNEGLIE